MKHRNDQYITLSILIFSLANSGLRCDFGIESVDSPASIVVIHEKIVNIVDVFIQSK